MTYKSNADLPDTVKALPAAAQTLFREGYNAHKSDNPDAAESVCTAAGWAAVATKFKKSSESWVAKDAAISLSFADSYDPENLSIVLHDGKPRRTGDGYMTAIAKVARTGIQIYRGDEMGRPDLAQVRVYRPASAVFSKDALRSIAHKPIVLDHPPDGVNSKNWKQLSGGDMGGEVARDGEYVAVPLVLMDEGLIQAVEQKRVRQLSLGYKTDVSFEQGVTDKGEPYDAVMENIRVNHLAIVTNARGGDQLKIGDNDRESPMATKTFTVDKVSVTVDDTAAQIIERGISDRDGVIKDLQSKLDKSVADAATAKTAADTQVADLTKQVSAKDGEIVVLKKAVEDGKITPAKMATMAKDHAVLIAKAASILGDKYPFDTKTEAEIMRDAVAKHMGDAEAAAVKAMDDAGIGGAFRAITKDVKVQAADGAVQLASVLANASGSPANGSAIKDAAFQEGLSFITNGRGAPAKAAN